MRYGALWKLRKPERMQVEITRADGSQNLQWFVLPPNVSTEVWFYPWSAPDLVHYFDADESHWRPSPRSAITAAALDRDAAGLGLTNAGRDHTRGSRRGLAHDGSAIIDDQSH